MPSKSTTPIPTRLDHDELAWVQQQAAARDTSVSAFIRLCVQRAKAGTKPPKSK